MKPQKCQTCKQPTKGAYQKGKPICSKCWTKSKPQKETIRYVSSVNYLGKTK